MNDLLSMYLNIKYLYAESMLNCHKKLGPYFTYPEVEAE